jgi:hypothetical protein
LLILLIIRCWMEEGDEGESMQAGSLQGAAAC